MININKQYRTKDGRQVKLYKQIDNVILGSFLDNNGKWKLTDWNLNGKFLSDQESSYDLIEDLTNNQPIFVSNTSENHVYRHFAKFDEDGSIMTYAGGRSKYTSNGKLEKWNYFTTDFLED